MLSLQRVVVSRDETPIIVDELTTLYKHHRTHGTVGEQAYWAAFRETTVQSSIPSKFAGLYVSGFDF